jgi:hypothetical protein
LLWLRAGGAYIIEQDIIGCVAEAELLEAINCYLRWRYDQ